LNEPRGEQFLTLKDQPKRGRKNLRVLGRLEEGTRIKLLSRDHGKRRMYHRVEVVGPGEHSGKVGFVYKKLLRSLPGHPKSE